MTLRDEIVDTQKLRQFLESDLRARQMVDTALVHSLAEQGEPEDGRDFKRYAYDIATRATAALLKMIYEEDAEIRRLRTERDHYKALAEEGLRLIPRPLKLNLGHSIKVRDESVSTQGEE
jgi:hypothetical protein